jgi:Domain of unknown function (DUF3883)
MQQLSNLTKELSTFSDNFDTAYEDKAVISRAQFIQSYPLNQLQNINLDEYVIGKGTASFCACVEAKTRSWANMSGATANKFGIYFGKTKTDPKMQYRFAQKFGKNKKDAFSEIKDELLNLVQAGESKQFNVIDKNRLSQMFKAKILSLYFPELYLNVCSAEHIERLAIELGVVEQQFVSGYQHLLVSKKTANKITKQWSNPKFMAFLYAKYIRDNLTSPTAEILKKPRKQFRRYVNFDEISANRNSVGKTSEEFAVEWEKNRLIGLGYQNLATKIKDRREFPSYGYDYMSFSAPGHARYIEVKSVGCDRNEGCFRFYLSENEYLVSNSIEHSADYYFYLVRYDKDGKPCDVLARHAKEFYLNSEMAACAYVLRFELEQLIP